MPEEDQKTRPEGQDAAQARTPEETWPEGQDAAQAQMPEVTDPHADLRRHSRGHNVGHGCNIGLGCNLGEGHSFRIAQPESGDVPQPGEVESTDAAAEGAEA